MVIYYSVRYFLRKARSFGGYLGSFGVFIPVYFQNNESGLLIASITKISTNSIGVLIFLIPVLEIFLISPKVMRCAQEIYMLVMGSLLFFHSLP